MKFFLLCWISLSLVSCSSEYEEDIKNIEILLGTDLNVEYEITNVATPFDFAYYYLSFDLKFNQKDFDSLLKDINFDNFEKIDWNDLEFSKKNRFYREYIDDDSRISLVIDRDNNAMHYSSKR